MNFKALRRPLFSAALILLLLACGGGERLSTDIPLPITTPTGQTSTQVPSQTSPTQATPPKNQFNPKEYDKDELRNLVGCVDPILGSKITDEIFYDGRPPTAEEINKIAGCLGEVATGKKQGEAGAEEVLTQTSPTQAAPTGQTSTQVPSQASPTQTAVAKNQFNPKEYDKDELSHLVGCVDPILGSKVTDEIVYDGRPPTAEEIDKIAGCLVQLAAGKKQGEVGAEEGEKDQQARTEEPTILTSLPNAPPSPLRKVSLPEASHLISDKIQCDAYENKKCVDLRWERIDGLLAGAITTLDVSLTNPNVVYAGLDSNGMSLWKSEDSGNKWKLVYQWAHASDVAVSPSNPSTILYSELEEGVYISTDGGGNWDTAIGGNDPDWVRSSGLYFKTLAFSVDSPEVAYAVASHERGPSSLPAEVYRSDNGGRTWNHSGACKSCGSVYDVVVQPGSSTTLWAAGDFGVHVSEDSGKTWSDNLISNLSGVDRTTSQSKAATIGLAVNPQNPELLLAATSASGVYRSIDSGQTWELSSTGLGALKTHQVAFAPSDPNVVWLTTHDGVYRSTDMGKTWTRRDNGWQYTFTNALAIDPENSNVAYVGTAVELMTAHSNHTNEGIHEGGGLYKTVDGGNNWQRIDRDMEESNIVAMGAHPYLPFNLWVGDKAGRGAFVTKDGGDTWLNAAWTASHYPMVFAFSSSVPSKHFLSSAVRRGELTVSVNGGSTWLSLADGLGTAVDQSTRASRLPSETGNYFHVHLHGLAIAPSDPNIIYTGTIYDPSVTEVYSMMGAVIFTSRDGGITWKESSNGFPIETPTSLNAFVVHPTDPNTAYAMTSGYESTKAIGIYKTTDGGSSWRPVNEGLDPNTRDLQIDPLSPGTLYAATGSGVYKTVDGAESWSRTSIGLPSAGSYNAQEQLLNILRGSGDRRGVFDLAIDPINPLHIYAATTKGVYKTKNGGDHWYAVNFGLPLPGGNPFWHDRVIEIDATGRVLYTALAPEVNGKRGNTQIYRAIIEPLLPLKYEFELNEKRLEIESNSHLYDIIFEQRAQELRFTVTGPDGLEGEVAATIPVSLLTGPFTVTVDKRVIDTSTNGQTLSFGYTHAGRSTIIIKGS